MFIFFNCACTEDQPGLLRMHSIKNLSSKTVWAQNLRRWSPPWTVFWAVLANTHPGLIRLTYSEWFRGHARSWAKDLWIKGQLAVAFYSLILRAVANCSEKSVLILSPEIPTGWNFSSRNDHCKAPVDVTGHCHTPDLLRSSAGIVCRRLHTWR